MTAFCTAGVAPMVPASPMPFTPRGLSGLRVSVLDTSKDGKIRGRRHEVVDEGGGVRVAVLVVLDLLEQSLPGAGRDAAVLLAGDDERVEHEAAVVDGDVTQEPDPAGLGVHLDHRHVGAERKAGLGLLEDHRGAEAVGLGLILAPGWYHLRPSVGAALRIGGGLGELGPAERRGRARRRRRGRPPSSSTMSSGAASSRWAASLLALARTASAALSTAVPPICSERDPPVPLPWGTRAVSDCTKWMRSIGMPSRSVTSIEKRRVVALPVGGRPDPDGRAAVVVDLDRAPLGPEAAGGDLHVGADPDAELHGVVAIPAGLLLPAQVVVAGHPKGFVEGLGVLAAVVGHARSGGIGKGVVGDEVAAPDLGRIDAELGRRHVHDPLEQGGGLRPAGAAERADRGGVGRHGHRAVIDLRDLVDALGEHVRRPGGHDAAEPGIGTGVAEDPPACR